MGTQRLKTNKYAYIFLEDIQNVIDDIIFIVLPPQQSVQPTLIMVLT